MKSLILSTEGIIPDITATLNYYIKKGYKVKILELHNFGGVFSVMCIFKLKTGNPNLRIELDEIYKSQLLIKEGVLV